MFESSDIKDYGGMEGGSDGDAEFLERGQQLRYGAQPGRWRLKVSMLLLVYITLCRTISNHICVNTSFFHNFSPTANNFFRYQLSTPLLNSRAFI